MNFYKKGLGVFKGLILFIYFLFFNVELFSIVVGSNTSVSRQSNVFFPSTDSNNEILGFAWLDEGFTLSNIQTTCTYNAVFPISGEVRLNGGTFYLNQDLEFRNDLNLVTIGSIYGNNKNIHFSNTVDEFSFPGLEETGIILNLIDETDTGNIVNSVAWSKDDSYIAVGIDGSFFGIDDVRVYYFDGATLTLTAESNLFDDIYSVDWHPYKDYLLASRSQFFLGNELNVFELNVSNGTFNSVSSVGSPGNDCYSATWHPWGNFLAAGWLSATNRVIVYPFNQSNGSINFAGRILANTMPNTAISSSEGLDWNYTGSYLAVGTPTSAGAELLLYYFDGSTLTLTLNAEIGRDVNSVKWKPDDTKLAIGLSSGTESFRVYEHNISNGTLTEITDSRIGESSSILSLDWNYTGTLLSMGLVVNTNSEFRIYNFLNDNTLSINSELASTFDISSVIWSHNGDYLGRGDFQDFLRVYNFVSSLVFKDVNLFFDRNVTLKVPITVEGNCKINCNFNIFNIDQRAYFNIKPNSSLYFDNSNLRIFSELPIRPESLTSEVYFDNSNLLLNSNIFFDLGEITIDGICDFIGSYSLVLRNEATLTVSRASELFFKENFNLEAGSSELEGNSPITFDDSSSKFIFEKGVLRSNKYGLQLTKGKLNSKGLAILESSSSTTNQGIILGDGTASGDVNIIIDPGAELILDKGIITLDHDNENFINFLSDEANFYFRDGGGPYIKKTLRLENGSVRLDDIFTFTDSGIDYPIVVNNTEVIKVGSFSYVVTGTITGINQIVLENNDRYFLNYGDSTSNVNINGKSNLIDGNGNLFGTITLQDSNTSVSWDLVGRTGDIYLNGGEVNLTYPLEFFSSGGQFLTTGTVNLNSNILSMPKIDNYVITGTTRFEGNFGEISLKDNLTLTSSWNFAGTVIIEARNYLFDITNGHINIDRDSTLIIRDAVLFGLRDRNLSCISDTSVIRFSNCELNLFDDFYFSTGSIIFFGKNTIETSQEGGEYAFYYDSSKTSTILNSSVLEIGAGQTLSIGRKFGDSSVQPLEFETNFSCLCLNRGSLSITSSGATFTVGKLETDGDSNINIASNHSDYGLIIGDGNEINDFSLLIDDFSTSIDSGALIYNNFNAEDKFLFSDDSSTLELNQNAKLILNRDLKLKTGQIYFNGSDSLEVLNGTYLHEENVINRYASPYSLNRFTGRLTTQSDYHLFNEDYLVLQEGALLANINLKEVNGNVSGGGSFILPITLQDSTISLSVALLGNAVSDINLNGGRLYINSKLDFYDDKFITGSGQIHLSKSSIYFGGTGSLNLTNTLDWFNASDINLKSKVDLTGQWKFNGTSILNGHGNILDLTTGGTLYVRSGATLNLSDVVIKGLGVDKGWIDFEDDTGVVNLSNVQVELENNYNTQQGGFFVDGPSVFTLKNYNWTFDNNASLTVDGLTLWKDPVDYEGSGSEGDILFGSGDESKYLTLTQSGTIKYLYSSASASGAGGSLVNQVRYNSNAVLSVRKCCEYNSNAIIDNDNQISWNSSAILGAKKCCENNSNAIINILDDISHISSATIENDDQIRWNSSAILQFDQRIINNSNAIIDNDNQISWNSSAILQFDNRITNNSNAIILLSEDLTDTYNYLNNNISYNSSAILSVKECCENNSNAIVNLAEDISHISSATIENDDQIRWNSSAILNIDDNITNNSNAIIHLSEDLTDTYNYLNNNISYNSSAILSVKECCENNSNAIVNIVEDISHISSATIENDDQIRWNSNAILNIDDNITNNSNAIINLSEDLTDTYNYLNNNISYNSSAILSVKECCENNSNAIINILDDISHISSATIENDDQIRWNSSAILNIDDNITNNSNAIINLSEDLTDTYNYLNNNISYNSSAILSVKECCENNSNAIINILNDISHISSATIENDDQISWNSSAILNIDDNITNNSNA
ncbi:hypothetical protein GF385_04795, partial [Candidatus Dependentiae bacterium]|nr:hypothetical protein [Candidatus Dependentiae bacterium]